MVGTMSPLARSKLLKQTGTPITGVESKLCEAYLELEAHSKEFQADMKSLQFYSAQEVGEDVFLGLDSRNLDHILFVFVNLLY